MKLNRHSILTLASTLVVVSGAARAVEIPKLQNNTALNLPGSWTGGTVPGSGDVMLWNNAITTPWVGSNLTNLRNALPPLESDLSVLGLKVTDVGGTRHQVRTVVGYRNPDSYILTIGAGGIDLSSATQTLFLNSRIQIGADQSWNISDANTNSAPANMNISEDLAFLGPIGNTPLVDFDFGGQTVTTTGAGQGIINTGFTVKNGTLQVGNNEFCIQGGDSQRITLDSNFNLEVLEGGALRMRCNSGVGGISLQSAAPISVNGGATLIFHHGNNSNALNQTGPIWLGAGSTINMHHANPSPNIYSGDITVAGAATWTVTGGGANFSNVTGNLIGAGDISYLNTATNSSGLSRFSGDNSGYTGAITLAGGSGTRALRLGSADSGSAAATWNVNAGNTLQIDGVAVQLGTLNGAGQVTNSHSSSPATAIIGAGIFSGIVSNGSGTTSVTKTGPGTLSLTGPNTYDGTTTVSEGTLFLSSAHFGGGAVDVADGATLGTLILEADGYFGASSLNLGSSTGSTLVVDMGMQPNPDLSVIYVGTLAVNAPTTVRLAAGNLSTGSFPLIEYYGTLEGLGVSGLNLVLPPRTEGYLSEEGNELNVTITATDKIRWKGNEDEVWDIDPDGAGITGTPNWVTLSDATATRYIQADNGSDSVIFDDSADSGAVSLADALSPVAMSVNNSTALDYVFTGPGKLTGAMSLIKSGEGSLTLANTGMNDYTGGTRIEDGALLLGDGVTAGAGYIPGNILLDGELVLNRPDDHDTDIAVNPSSQGTLRKAQDNTVSFPSEINFPSGVHVAIDDGTLRFVGGGTLSGVLEGSGALAVAGGALTLAGAAPNTFSGPVSVHDGILELDKGSGLQAVGGDITLTGSATLILGYPEQIADTATLNVLGTSNNPLPTSGSKETVGNVYINVSSPTGELVVTDEFTVADTVTVENGIFSIRSGHEATANRILLASPTAIVRVSGNSGASALHVGSGGIEASGGEIQVKSTTSNQNAVLNLGGNLVTTGNLAISNAGYNGGSLNVINLTAGRVFDIGAGTTTTVAPDLGGEGSLTKAGQGTLVLGPLCAAAHEEGTVIDEGTLLVNGSHTGDIQVNATGTLGGAGTISGDTDVAGTVSPGSSTGMLTAGSTVTLGSGSIYHWEIGDWTGATAGTDWDLLSAGSLVIAATPDPVTIRVTGTPANFTESGATFEIVRTTGGISGFSVGAFEVDSSGFVGTGTWEVQQNGSSIELVYTAGAGTPFSSWAADHGIPADAALDSDGDGIANGIEFVLGTNPAPGHPDSNSNDKLPVILNQGDVGYEPEYLTFVFRRSAVSESYNPAVEHSGDLVPESWTPAVDGEGGVIVSTGPSGDAGVELVTVKIPRAGAARLFVRLRVEID